MAGRIAGGRSEAKVAAVKLSVEQVRLAGGSRYYLGRVEVKINGEWGMICGDRWTMKNAMVVCRELGLGYASRNYSHALFKINGRTLMSGTTCLGQENSLDECLRHSLNNVSCSRNRSVAGVRCWKGRVLHIQPHTRSPSIPFIHPFHPTIFFFFSFLLQFPFNIFDLYIL